jgi:hypothetical protein
MTLVSENRDLTPDGRNALESAVYGLRLLELLEARRPALRRNDLPDAR